jgi:hypothetical protein
MPDVTAAEARENVTAAEARERRRRRRAASFGAAVAAYERGRPLYPPEAVAWLVPETARTVVDLGAGTES